MTVCIEKCWNRIRLRDNRLFFALGLGAILLLMLITWSKGGAAQWYSNEHDQTVINSVLTAKHDVVFNEFEVIPEFLNGVSASALHHEAIGSFLFYYFFPARTAFFGHLFFCTLIAYIGMFLCLRDFAGGVKLSLLP